MKGTIATTKYRKIEECDGKLTLMVGHDKILDLAKNGLCPHYVLTNPSTKEETILFSKGELEDWLRHNYLQQVNPTTFGNAQFMRFDPYVHTLKDFEKVPFEISKIKNLKQLPLEKLKTPPGIYFLCKDKQLVYIGKSIDVLHRIMNHIKQKKKDFDTVFYIAWPETDLDRIETALIRFYNPIYNGVDLKPNSRHEKIVKDLKRD